MAGVPVASIAGNMVVTPEMVPPNPAPYDEEATFFNTLADDAEDTQRQWNVSNRAREQSAQSPGFEEGHEKNRQAAADFGRLAGVYRDAGTYFSSVAEVYRNAHRSQQSAINNANNELREAKTPAEQQAIITRWHTHARSLTTSAIAEAAQKAQTFRTNAGSDITALDSRTKGPAPQAPALPQGGGKGIAVPVGKTDSALPDDTDADGGTTPATDGTTATGASDNTKDKGRPKWAPRDGSQATGNPVDPSTPSSPWSGSSGQTPLSGGSGLESLGGFPGALSSGGGGLSSMASGGGLGGLGSGGGLSGLTSGGLPGAQSAGLGGLPGSASAAPQAATSAGAFSQGLSAGSNAGSALSSLPPATGTGSATAASSQAGAAAPTAGLAEGTAPSAGLGAAGASPGGVSASSGTAGSASSTGGSAAPGAMIVPPPGMGAPAAPVAAGTGAGSPGASVMPAGNAGSSSNAVGGAGAVPSAAGSNGAMLVPASIVAGGNNTGSGQRQRTDSPELASAKALALKLRRDCDGAKYPCIDWAIGIFRSESGGATECVVTSNEGFGYIPWGVFLPRSARLLGADRLADNGFRELWFGCEDPAQVMVEYAKLRAQRGSRLVALGVTADSAQSRIPGVEYGICAPRNLNEVYSEPVLDDMHTHRLEVLHPDLFARLQRLTATEDATRAFANQACVPLAMQIIDAVQMAAGVQSPPELRQMWDALGTGDAISDDEWQQYLMASMVFYVNLSASRLPLDAGLAERERYHAEWVTARAMEFLRGWQRTPPDVADMIYAAAVAYPGDFAAKFEPHLRAPEAALAK